MPVLVKEDPGDGASLEMAIIENVQREDLNCIEEAMAYQQLLDEFQLSQDEISVRVGKNRATIANMLRLLRLPQAIREDLTNAKMTMGHARALLSLDSAEDQVEIRDQIIRRKLSVRETERKVNEVLRKNKKGTQPERGATEPNIQALEESLRRQFGTQVRIVGNEMRGFLQFTYGSKEDLMRLVDKLQGFKSIDNSDVSPAN